MPGAMGSSVFFCHLRLMVDSSEKDREGYDLGELGEGGVG